MRDPYRDAIAAAARRQQPPAVLPAAFRGQLELGPDSDGWPKALVIPVGNPTVMVFWPDEFGAPANEAP